MMKKQLTSACASVLLTFAASAQSATFSDQSSVLLPTTAFHSGNAIGICDMNNDMKDDIIRASMNNTMYIEYQNAPNSLFTELSFSNTIGDPWGMCVADVNNDGFNDVFWGDYGNTIVLTRATPTTFTSNNWASTTTAPFIFVQGCNFFDINNDHFVDGSCAMTMHRRTST